MVEGLSKNCITKSLKHQPKYINLSFKKKIISATQFPKIKSCKQYLASIYPIFSFLVIMISQFLHHHTYEYVCGYFISTISAKNPNLIFYKYF